MSIVSLSVQPFASVTETMYLEFEFGDTVNCGKVSFPGVQTYLVPPDAFNVAEDPLQIV